MDNVPYSGVSEDELRTIARRVKDHVPVHASNNLNSDHILKLQNLIERVYSTASRPDLSAAQNVASWNCLCALIDQSLNSPSVSVQYVVLRSDILARCCALYLKQGAHARPKSAKQLLATIGNALKKYSNHGNVHLLKQTLVRSLRVELLDGAKSRSLKSTLLMLSHLLVKGILTVEEFSGNRALDRIAFPASDRNSSVEDNFDLYEVLMRLATNGEYASSIGQTLAVILSPQAGATTEGQRVWKPRWAGPLKKAFTESPGDVDKLSAYVLPVIFRQNVAEFAAFLEDLGWSNRNDIKIDDQYELLLCASLVTGNAIGALSHVDERAIETNKPGRVPMSHHQIEFLLKRASKACRMAGLTLLIASPVLTRPFQPHTLNLLRKHLQHLHADTDADFRGELFGVTSKLFDRLRAATALLERESHSTYTLDVQASTGSLQVHEKFLWWYLSFLEWELRPSASYQRHICATRCILIAIKSGIDGRVPQSMLSKSAQGPTRWCFGLDIMRGAMMQLLLDLLMDPFEDVRQSASSCLSVYSDVYTRPDGNAFTTTLQNAERRMLVSGRADHCDGVAHLNAQLALQEARDLKTLQHLPTSWTLDTLVQKLHEALKIAEADLSTAVKNYPLHGLLTSLRYILMTGRTAQSTVISTVQRVLPLIHDVWQVVKDVLCNDAPEGYLPERSVDTLLASTKDILSFSWRALKEASLLTGTILMLLPSLQQLNVGSKIGFQNSLRMLTFTQLAELRHRGAFSTVAQTWVICCTQSKQLQNSISGSEFLAWYEQVLVLLHDKVTVNTRRSAGLPALLCGILVADSSDQMFNRATIELEAIARSPVEAHLAHEGSLPQVHAMNCIKDILKNSKLSERSERYITPALRLAADSLLSQAWAIRNCGLMLFRAVIDRMVGTNDPFDEEESLQKFDIFGHHPGLLETILSLLQPRASEAEMGVQRGEAVFPALQLLQRGHVSDAELLDVQVAVLELTCNATWHIRVMAARTYAALVKLDETEYEVNFVLSIASTTHQNSLHGALLCAKFLIMRQIRYLQSSSSSDGDRLQLFEVAQRHLLHVLEKRYLFDKNNCGFTKAAWIHLLRVSQHLLQLTRPLLIPRDTLLVGAVGNNGFDTVAELKAVLETEISKDLSACFLRQALATAATESLPHGPSDEEMLLRLYADLAKKDVNAFDTAFSSTGQPQLQDARVEKLIIRLLDEDNLPSVAKIGLQSCLLATLRARKDIDKTVRLISMPKALASDVLTPYAISDLVELQALLIESAAASGKNIDDDLREWVGACELILRDPLDHTRESVARGLTYFDITIDFLGRQAADEELSRSFMMMIYDLLNDDDEDVRILTSDVAGRISREAGQANHTCSPIVASQSLLGCMVRRWYQSSDFAAEAFFRAFETRRDCTISFDERIHRTAQDDSVLFAEEKQNLYIDHARETRAWSQVIMRTDAHSIKYEAIAELAKWTLEGLNFFLREAEQGLSLYERSYEADIFTLVLRLFYGVEVLLWFVNKGVLLPHRPSLFLVKLHSIAQGLRQQEKGYLWLSEAQRILDGAVAIRLQSMRRLMDCITGGSG